MATELVSVNTYICFALKTAKDREQPKGEGKEGYSYNIAKVDQIFNHLLKDRQIKLTKGHQILLLDELNGKKYYKWHNSFNHTTKNCIVFHNTT